MWVGWLIGWVRRVELRERADPEVRRLGLSWMREGVGGRVRAHGRRGEVELLVEWRLGLAGVRVRVREGDGRWRRVPAEGPVGEGETGG